MSVFKLGVIVAVADELGSWVGRVDVEADPAELQPTVVCLDPKQNPLRQHGMRVVCTQAQLQLVSHQPHVPDVRPAVSV